MQIDMLERLTEHVDTISHLREGLACLAEHRDERQPGIYAFPGGYLMLQTGVTIPAEEGYFEAHQRYLDVQVLLNGSETVIWADIETLREVEPYCLEKDYTMYAGQGISIPIHPGMCYICRPQDGHKACRHTEQANEYRKAVIKLEYTDCQL